MTPPTPSTGLPTDGAHAGATAATTHPTTRTSWRSRPLERILRRLLTNVSCGTLTVELPGGERAEGRGAEPGPHGTIVLHRWKPLWRLAVGGDLGLAESYRQGEWSSPDLAALLELGVRNEAGWGRALQASLPARLVARLFHLRRANTRRGSRQNIAFHYDMGNDFYTQWLDPDMLYSSAIYATGQESLEQAQQAKLARIATLLSPKAGERVLEIGCGWGALAIALARDTGADVTGLTLSSEQLRHARQRVQEESLTERVDLRLQDYRDVDGQFDHIVSIEMLEAVGERYWPAYFETLKERLRPGGRAVVQVITIADEHFEQYRSTTDFIQRYIFPGGMLPSPSRLRDAMAQAGLALQAAETFGPSYATTLAEWRHRFLSAWPSIEPLGFDAPFRRLWEYYLCYCEAGFSTGRVDVGLYTIVHADTGATAARPVPSAG
ncbi:SAM-dependent methyltransferase [Paracidovorax valerianellae]|uniref:SAM-dependent methyltransferase n=1 Tax=Paracidovorax valerianellae TaxID=187868 RepID=UPI0023037C7E|nr:cyclopropane-fatty-acyl-phospholipid synthase family protein [Paracidovorax valerianellae]MDA8444616.1 cyclopropane-fatty-acyl-phospholipid synthase family protein [Paracidovorax valerianellae]